MSKPKVFVLNYNNVLDTVEDYFEESGQLTDNYHQADVFLIWEDVRGVPKEVARIAKEHLGKPVVVMQHGRGATRDYCKPNNFPLLADRILVWGPVERDRLLRAGVSKDKIVVTGCPLFPLLKRKNTNRDGLNVLYAPVIAEMEQPENLLVYAALKKWESERLMDSLLAKFDGLKKGWATQNNIMRPVANKDGTIENRVWKTEVVPTIPRNVTYSQGLLNVKLTGVHDAAQYMSPMSVTQQGQDNHIDSTLELLANTDVLVCLEEGTMQLLASALDIPVIVADIFKYGNYGGVANYDSIEKIHTNACYWTTKLEKIPNLLNQALKNPAELRKNRIRVCEEEGGANMGNITMNIVRAVEEVACAAV